MQMHELDDQTLLRQYAEQNSEAAFAALVARHVDKVYSTALRHTRNDHAAEEITQAVFVIFARKAISLRRHTALSGWFYETARLTAVTYIRSEIRRAHREQEAHMQTTLNGGGDASTPSDLDNIWRHIEPELDEALSKLSAADRHAIVLRYFDGKSLGEVGAALGASEGAAKKRVSRAVEKLRGWFTKRGVTLTATVLTAAISANSVQAAPLGLASTVTATAAKGAAVGSSILTLIKGASKVMAWTKVKTAVAVGVGVLLAAGTATVVVKDIQASDLDDKWFALDNNVLEEAPAPIRIIRPTHFAGRGLSSGMIGGSERAVGQNTPFETIFIFAYGNPRTRMVLPKDLPLGQFDFLMTLPKDKNDIGQDKVRKILREEIARKFGFVGREEMREMDVLVLKVKKQNSPALRPSAPNQHSEQTQLWEEEKVVGKALDISSLAFLVEGRFNLPVIDKTGLKGRYDFELKYPQSPSVEGQQRMKNDLLVNLGLELVPAREKVEMLVVEKVK